MENENEVTPIAEIVDGLPVLIKSAAGNRSIIRVRPKSTKKERVERPLSISRGEQRALTIKARHALKNYFSGMTKTASGEAAGYKTSSAIKSVNNALRIATGNQAFLEEMDKQNISNEKLIKILDKGLEATHPLSKDNKKDYRTIYNYWHDAIKLKDGFPAKKVLSQSDNRHLHIHITEDDKEGIDKYERMREEALNGSPDPY